MLAPTLAALGPTGAKAALKFGAIAFIYRFTPSLTEHVNFHVCVATGVMRHHCITRNQTLATIGFWPSADIGGQSLEKFTSVRKWF